MKQTNNQQNKILKAIKRGDFKDKYLIYNRQSMDEAESQKNSISYQTAENVKSTKLNGLQIADVSLAGFATNGIISEKHSGYKENDELFISENGLVQFRIERPKFQQLVMYLNRGYFKGIVCLCWDRVSRNKGDNTILEKLMNKGVDLKFAYASYDKTSSGKLHMDIDEMFAVHHSRVTSEKISLALHNNRAKGKCTYRAPLGYINNGTMDHKPFDTERAPIIKELFTRYASGEWTLNSLAAYAAKQGLTSRPQRRPRTREEKLDETINLNDIEKVCRPLNAGHVSRILNNPFYIGKTIGPEGFYIDSTSHEALVSVALFDEVQEVLKKKTVSVKGSNKICYPLRGIVRCVHCNRVYTPYRKKGVMYYGARCKQDCKNTMKSFNLSFVSEKIESLLTNLQLTKEQDEFLDASVSTEMALLEQRRNKELLKIERKKKTIRENLAYLRTERFALLKSGLYTPKSLADEENALDAELSALQQNEQISDEAMRDLVNEVVTLSELVKQAQNLVKNATEGELDRLTRSMFSELLISNSTLNYKAQKGFEPILNRTVSFCDRNAWLSEFCVELTHIKRRVHIVENAIVGT